MCRLAPCCWVLYVSLLYDRREENRQHRIEIVPVEGQARKMALQRALQRVPPVATAAASAGTAVRSAVLGYPKLQPSLVVRGVERVRPQLQCGAVRF